MSAQGATLRRGTVHIPIWPVAIVVVAATAAVIGLSAIDGPAPARTITTVTDAERLANSTAAIREQGAVAPLAVGISHVAPSAVGFAGFENPGAYGISQVTEAAHPVGLENPGAYPEAGSESDAGFRPTMGARPGMAGDEVCGQCR
jgi:hypothetical protein